MRSLHLEAFAPVCPTCRVHREVESPLRLTTVTEQHGDHVVQGVLLCSESGCQREYPILDGIPIIIDNLRAFISHNSLAILGRRDLTPTLGTLLGDCLGPGSDYDTLRQHISHYAEDHWSEFDAADAGPPSGAAHLLQTGLGIAESSPANTAIDLGCATGRTTFELAAKTAGPVLGIDLHIGMLRVASRALRESRARYGRRRVGMVYDERDIPLDLNGDRVDFWLADATSLPLADGAADLAVSLNVLDCVQSPHGHLTEISRMLSPGGTAILATPYDWSPTATAVESWLGGHSQRGPEGGSPPAAVRRLLSGEHIPGLHITAEREFVPWRVRLHDRCTVEYQSHLLALARSTTP